MPWAGWKRAAVTAGAAGGPEPPAGLPLPAVGSVGRTSGPLPAELEQPAAVMAATMMTMAAESLFMSCSSEFRCGSVRSHSLVSYRTMRRTYGANRAVGYA